MSKINEATKKWWLDFEKTLSTSANAKPFNEFYKRLIFEVIRVLDISNLEINNKNIAEFIDPNLTNVRISKILESTQSEILSTFLHYHPDYRGRLIVSILPGLTNCDSNDIKDYLL